MVLKEMIKSTKAMVRAKEVDLARLKKKYANQDFAMNNLSDDDRQQTALRSGIAKQKPGLGSQQRLGAVGLLKSGPSHKLKVRSFKNGAEADPQEDEPERIVSETKPAAP